MLAETNVLEVMRKLRKIFQELRRLHPKIFVENGNSYYVASVGRKLILALMAWNRVTVDWSTMTAEQLRQLCVDQSGFIDAFPDDMSAAEISNLVFGRPDWAMFVSLEACLMKDVLSAYPVGQCREELIKVLASDSYVNTSRAENLAQGHGVHPALVVQEMRRESDCLSGCC